MAIKASDIRDWTIYKITNPKGRIYIGKSSNYIQRLRHYKSIKGKGQLLMHRSMLKYGVSSHKFDVVDTFTNTGIYAEGKEMFWIKTFMSNISKFPEMKGINMTDGGEGALGCKKSDKFREDCRKRNLGKKHTQEWKDNQSVRMKGNKYSLGVKMSTENKIKMSVRLKGVKFSEEKRKIYESAFIKCKGKPIIQTTEKGEYIKEFPGIYMAQRELGVHNITLVLQGKMKNTKGLFFKYK